MNKFDNFLKGVNLDDILSQIINPIVGEETDPLKASVQVSSSFTIALLREYHSWLSEQLEESRRE